MNNLLDYKFLIPLVLLLGFAHFFPQPHIVEKIRMLMAGTRHLIPQPWTILSSQQIS
jgi:hypothetical protein